MKLNIMTDFSESFEKMPYARISKAVKAKIGYSDIFFRLYSSEDGAKGMGKDTT